MPSRPGHARKKPSGRHEPSRGRKRVDQDLFYKTGIILSRAASGIAGFFAGIFSGAAGLLEKLSAFKNGLRYLMIGLLIVILGAGGWLTYYLMTNKNATEVYLNGITAGIIKETAIDAAEIERLVRAKLEKDNGAVVDFPDKITAELVHAVKKDLISSDAVISAICSLVKFKVQAAGIAVDGVEMCIVASGNDAEEIKSQIIEAYVDPEKNIVEKSTVEEFSVTLKFVDKSEIISVDDAYKILTKRLETTNVYTTKSGDSYWSIAQDNNITLEELKRLNPGLDINATLSIGVKLNLKAERPLISVRTVERHSYDEVEPKKIEYQNDPNQPASYSKVIRQGSDGQRRVTEDIVRINGFETERIIVEKEITKEPVSEIIARGTK